MALTRRNGKKLARIIKDSDWTCAIPKDDDDKVLRGMIIGEDEYVNSILDQLK